MKKLLTCLLGAGLLFTMSGCSKSATDEALEATANGINHMQNMESASYQVGMKMGFMNESLMISFHGGYLEQDGKLNLDMIVDVNDANVSNTLAKAYMKDDNLFIDMDDAKIKLPLGELLSDMSGETATTNQSSEKMSAKELIPYVTKGTKKDNEVVLTLENKAIEEYLQESLEKQSATSGYDAKVKVESAIATLKFENEFIVDIKVDLDTNIDMNLGSGTDMTTNMKFTIFSTFTDINQNKEVNFPVLGEEYKETSIWELLSLLGQEL